MLVFVQKWGNSAALRLPAVALKDAGMHVGQSLDLQVDEGTLVLRPVTASLDDLLSRVTSDNRHDLAFEAPAAGGEAW